jgi:N-acetylglutamate synthase-like GNAT family acetyltransferase
MEQIIVSSITYSSPKYPQVVELRDEVLRRPLGLSIKNDDLSRDLVDTIFIAEQNDALLGCLLVHRLENNEAQLRAMAVYDRYQGKGIGRRLVQAAEAYAWEQGYEKIILHARKVALGFYQSMGYTVTSDEFIEVNIPHYMMEKVKLTAVK